MTKPEGRESVARMKFKHAFCFVTLLSFIIFFGQPAVAGDRPKPNELVWVEANFSEQFTPEQREVFERHGGIVDYVFQAVAYGWTGRLPRNQINVVRKKLGSTLVYFEQGSEGELFIPTVPQVPGTVPWFPIQ